jgi:hypothetical protein
MDQLVTVPPHSAVATLYFVQGYPSVPECVSRALAQKCLRSIAISIDRFKLGHTLLGGRGAFRSLKFPFGCAAVLTFYHYLCSFFIWGYGEAERDVGLKGN